MKTNFKIAIMIVIASLMLVACEKDDEIIVGKDNPFIGTWNMIQNTTSFSLVYVFTDNTFTYNMMEGDWEGVQTGTYTYTDTTIHFTYNANPEFQIEEGFTKVEDYIIIENTLRLGYESYIKE